MKRSCTQQQNTVSFQCWSVSNRSMQLKAQRMPELDFGQADYFEHVVTIGQNIR